MICHADGPSSISDLDDEYSVWFPKQSGSAETWKNFVAENDDYADIRTPLNTATMKSASYEEALLKVTNAKTCMLYVGAAGATQFMQNVESSAVRNKLVLIDVDDSELSETTDPSGSTVYTYEQIDSTVYPNLSRQSGMFYGEGDVDTLHVNADLILATEWKDANKAEYPQVVVKIRGMHEAINVTVKQR